MECIFRFSGESHGVIKHLLSDNHVQVGNEIMRNSVGPQIGFNDFNIYQQLCSEKGCEKVEVASINVRHNRFCHGLQVSYRSIFADGRTSTFECPPHFFSSGYYSYEGGNISNTRIYLENSEYLIGLRIHQGDIMDGITFVTNRREVHCGGHGGTFYENNMMLSKENTESHTHQIVSFTGSSSGVLQRIGYYAIPMGWTTIRNYVMMRWLKDQNRAFPLKQKSIINALTDMPDDIFRSTLSFLI